MWITYPHLSRTNTSSAQKNPNKPPSPPPLSPMGVLRGAAGIEPWRPAGRDCPDSGRPRRTPVFHPQKPRENRRVSGSPAPLASGVGGTCLASSLGSTPTTPRCAVGAEPNCVRLQHTPVPARRHSLRSAGAAAPRPGGMVSSIPRANAGGSRAHARRRRP